LVEASGEADGTLDEADGTLDEVDETLEANVRRMSRASFSHSGFHSNVSPGQVTRLRGLHFHGLIFSSSSETEAINLDVAAMQITLDE
jgi:hypothetical protein